MSCDFGAVLWYARPAPPIPEHCMESRAPKISACTVTRSLLITLCSQSKDSLCLEIISRDESAHAL